VRQLIRLYDILLVLSIIALWASLQLSAAVENLIGYFLVLTIGVGHGANDIKIFFRDKKLSTSRAIWFIAVYTVAVILGFGAFFIIPDFILALFIIVSGFHFGQEHYEQYELPKSFLKTLFLTIYGLTIIVALLYTNSEASLPIINDLIYSKVTTVMLAYGTYGCAALMFMLGLVLLRTQPITQLLRELFYLVVLLVIFKISSLLWGFAIYFVLWHSVPSIHHQIHHLYGHVSKSTLLQYLKSSSLYWVAALLFLAILYYFLNERTAQFLTVIVAFLGGITFPHVLVMHNLQKNE
jgi:Brp/Blh family beta-carotene 15,15'-monooxygenase